MEEILGSQEENVPNSEKRLIQYVFYLHETNGFALLFKHLAHDFILRHLKSVGKSTHKNCQPLQIITDCKQVPDQ